MIRRKKKSLWQVLWCLGNFQLPKASTSLLQYQTDHPDIWMNQIKSQHHIFSSAFRLGRGFNTCAEGSEKWRSSVAERASQSPPATCSGSGSRPSDVMCLELDEPSLPFGIYIYLYTYIYTYWLGQYDYDLWFLNSFKWINKIHVNMFVGIADINILI